MRRTKTFEIVPWIGGRNTSVDPGVLNPQELTIADNVQFSSTGARIKREAFEYLDLAMPAPDFRSSSTTTRTLKWTSSILKSTATPDEKLVVGERINVTGHADYLATDVEITAVTGIAEVTTVLCVGDTAGSLSGKYFLLSAGDPGNDYYVWYDVDNGSADPGISGRTGIAVDISAGDSADTVASATRTVLQAHDDFSASVSTATVTVTCALPGYTIAPGNGDSGFTTTVTTEGAYSITYTSPNSVSESITAAAGVTVTRASAVIMTHDFWYFDGAENTQVLVFATDDFQLFTLDDSGRRNQIHGQEQKTAVTCEAESTLTTGDHFLLNGAGDENNAYVWYNIDTGGGDPSVASRTGIEVALASGDTAAQVALATKNAIDAAAHFSATLDDDVVTILNATAGMCAPAVDVNTDFDIVTILYGATLPAVPLRTIKTNVFNERLQIYFDVFGAYPIIYDPNNVAKYQLMGSNLATGMTMPDASFAFNHLGRVFANDKSNPDYLHYSETFDETIWLGLGDSGAVPVFPGDGDPEGIVNAYVYKGFVVISKKDSRFRMLGDSPENFQIERISAGMGNEGALAIPVDEVDVVFISSRGIHSQQVTDQYGDTDAAYLSRDIKPDFNTFQDLGLIQGTYIPELNSIALAIAEAGEDAANNLWLYNFEIQVPGKDRPGAWYRWPDVSCTALTRRLTGNKHKIVMGTVDGRIIQAQRARNFSDFDEVGIPFKIKTGTIYPGNDPHSMKAFKRITMLYRPRGNFSFGVLAKIDNHTSQGFSFNEISGLDLLGETFVLGASILGSSNTLAPFSFIMDGIGRGVTLTITQPSADEQIEVWGFIIEYENADIEQEVS